MFVLILTIITKHHSKLEIINLFHRNLLQKEIQKMQTRKEKKTLIQAGKRILFYKPKVLQKSLTTTGTGDCERGADRGRSVCVCD